MKSIKCADLGDSGGCEFEATGETNDEVIGKMFSHAAEVHKEKVENMSDEEKKGMAAKMTEMLDKQ